jgi:hypothetical protein
MPHGELIAQLITYLGGGGAILAVVTSAIHAYTGKGRDRAQAADLIVKNYSGLSDHYLHLSERLEADNTRLRKALIDVIVAEEQHQHKCENHDAITAAIQQARQAVIDTSQRI